MLFLSKNKFIFALVCNIVYAGQIIYDKNDIIPRRWRHANIFWRRWSSLLNGLLHRLTMPWPSLSIAPAYNAMAVSHDRAGLQCTGRPLWPHRFTTRRTTCTPAPAYNTAADSSVRSRGRLTHHWFQLYCNDHQLCDGLIPTQHIRWNPSSIFYIIYFFL